MIDDSGNATFPQAWSGSGVGAVAWLDNFNTIESSFWNGSWSPSAPILNGTNSLFLNGLSGNPNTNQMFVLNTDQTLGTMNVLSFSPNGTAGTPVSLGGPFTTGFITLDPSINTIYVGAQNGVAPPQLVFLPGGQSRSFTSPDSPMTINTTGASLGSLMA